MKKFLAKLGVVALAAVMPLSVLACGNPAGSGTGGNDTPGGNDPPIDTDPPAQEWTVPEGAWTHSDRIMYVKDHGYCTGENAFVDTSPYNMTSTDLGFPFYDEDLGRLYVSFGDTNNNKVAGGGNEFQSNVTLYTDNLDFSQGIKWEGALNGQNGATRQVTPFCKRIVDVNRPYWGSDIEIGDVTNETVNSCIPTGVLVLDGTYYMWYMETADFLDTGEWTVYRNCVMKSSDKGVTWSKVDGLNWVCLDENNEVGIAPNFGQIYPLDGNDGYVYIYGIPNGRSGGVKLGRVAYANIENFEEYEYYRSTKSDGTVDWRKGSNGLKSIKNYNNSYIVAPMCGELCVNYNPYLQRYIMTYMQGNSTIVVRRSTTPWGTWSDSDAIMKQSDLNGLYGGFTCPALYTDNGKRMYMFVSEWYPVYNVHFIEVVFN